MFESIRDKMNQLTPEQESDAKDGYCPTCKQRKLTMLTIVDDREDDPSYYEVWQCTRCEALVYLEH